MTAAQDRPRLAWPVAAWTLAAAALGGLEAVRLGGAVARATVPVFACTGLVLGVLVAVSARLGGPSGSRGALIGAAPSLVVSIPLAFALGDGELGALPAAALLPRLALFGTWLVAAGLIAAGRALARDQLGRSIAIVALAGAIGGLVWVERHLIGAGAPNAHLAVTLAVLLLAGAVARTAYRGRFAIELAGAVAGLALGTGVAAMAYGLQAPADREQLATLGDHSRDLVWLWRGLLDGVPLGDTGVLGAACETAAPPPACADDR